MSDESILAAMRQVRDSLAVVEAPDLEVVIKWRELDWLLPNVKLG